MHVPGFRKVAMAKFDSMMKVDTYLLLAFIVLLINFRFQMLAFPLQCLLVLYAVFKGDVRYVPVVYLAIQDASYFEFLGVDTPIKMNFGIWLSVHNVFVIGTFFFAVFRLFKQTYDRRSMEFFAVWATTAIPAVYIAMMAKADNILAVWQTPLILFMVPAFYFWGIALGRTWDAGKEYFVKRMILVFLVQMVLQLARLYSVGCAFQDTIIPICFFFALLSVPGNILFKTLGFCGALVAFAVVFLDRYLMKMDTVGYAGNIELVSTFTRLGVTIIGVYIAVAAGNVLTRHALRAFPYVALLLCTALFAYATIRANTGVQGKVINSFGARTFAERFESKLVGDRGNVWLDAITTELFTSPLVFKRYKNIQVYHPEIDRWGEKMPPHNQVLTLLCRSGWWMGLVMVLFLWWMHIREFDAATLIADDRFTLCALLAPSAAIFVAVGFTGQHVFTQMWQSSSMASLTFPGILYGAVRERMRCGAGWRLK